MLIIIIINIRNDKRHGHYIGFHLGSVESKGSVSASKGFLQWNLKIMAKW